jgi:hypothetical protein
MSEDQIVEAKPKAPRAPRKPSKQILDKIAQEQKEFQEIEQQKILASKPIIPAERQSPLLVKKNRQPVNVNSIEAMTRETDRMVTGTFVNIECPGQPQYIGGQYYKGMPFFGKVFKDNERCSIPLSVARWINERFAYDKHKHILDPEGNPIKEQYATARGKFIIEHMAA